MTDNKDHTIESRMKEYREEGASRSVGGSLFTKEDVDRGIGALMQNGYYGLQDLERIDLREIVSIVLTSFTRAEKDLESRQDLSKYIIPEDEKFVRGVDPTTAGLTLMAVASIRRLAEQMFPGAAGKKAKP